MVIYMVKLGWLFMNVEKVLFDITTLAKKTSTGVIKTAAYPADEFVKVAETASTKNPIKSLVEFLLQNAKGNNKSRITLGENQLLELCKKEPEYTNYLQTIKNPSITLGINGRNGQSVAGFKLKSGGNKTIAQGAVGIDTTRGEKLIYQQRIKLGENGNGLNLVTNYNGNKPLDLLNSQIKVDSLPNGTNANIQLGNKLFMQGKENTEVLNKLKQESGIELPELKTIIANIQNSMDEVEKVTQKISNAKVGDDIAKYEKGIQQKLETPLEYDATAPQVKVAAKEEQAVKKLYPYKEYEAPVINAIDAPKTEDLIKKLDAEGTLNLDFPVEKEYKAVNAPNAYIGNRKIDNLNMKVNSDTTVRYGKGINWSNEKIARDIMQNFYDGHGHTLEGVKVNIKNNNGVYKVKVSGDGLYAPENIIYMGEGTKNINSIDLYNAGGFGEGSKVLTANMLYHGKANNIKFASADWELIYDKSCDDIEKAFVSRELKSAKEPLQGNYIEFETTDKGLVDKMVEARNYFYHPQNPDFHNLTFENEHWGFRLLGPKENGNLYMTQRFEFGQADNWNNAAENATVIFKRRPFQEKISDFSTGRDRTNITRYEVGKLIKKDFAKTMTDEELKDTMLKLEPVWNKDHKDKTSGFSAANEVFEALIEECKERKLGFNFGDKKFVADTTIGGDTMDFLKSKGYIECSSYMKHLGMPTSAETRKMFSMHEAVAPTQVQKKKLQLLEEGVSLLMKDDLIQKRLKISDIKQPRFVFDSKAQGYEELLGEAIINDGKYEGHWVSQKHINEANYPELLSTWLHEMTHQAGGDESKEFSYALTDVMGGAFAGVIKDPETAQKLSVLNKIFSNLN